MIEQEGIICEKGRDCKWKCFALDSQGFGHGKISNYVGAWMKWHERECGGRLIPVKIIENPEGQG
jgi:hypothetical protein